MSHQRSSDWMIVPQNFTDLGQVKNLGERVRGRFGRTGFPFLSLYKRGAIPRTSGDGWLHNKAASFLLADQNRGLGRSVIQMESHWHVGHHLVDTEAHSSYFSNGRQIERLFRPSTSASSERQDPNKLLVV